VTVPLSSQWGGLTESEINPVLSNVVEGSDDDDDDVQGTSIPSGAPSISHSDGILCVRAKQVEKFDKVQKQQKQKQKQKQKQQKQKQQQQQRQQDHSQHHHDHHRHNHGYHGLQQPQCCARLVSGDSGASGGKHRQHSNSCVLV
jgi:beta-lactam-binding protein with PASTA domain